nr:MAG TPA: hypothetical protein [Caudoviricetes sp.]
MGIPTIQHCKFTDFGIINVSPNERRCNNG